LELVDLRGNVPTRIAKLKQGEFDAIVLAAAGVKRLGFAADVSEYLPLEHVLPAVAQGAVALQVRQDDEGVLCWARQLDHAATRQATAAERALLNRLEGGCQVPVGALAGVTMGELSLRAVVCSLDGERSVEAACDGGVDRAEDIGRDLADELWEQGADAILQEIRAAAGNG
jgi:hydroxymethylbilane synthase